MKNNKYKDGLEYDRQHPSAKIIFKRIDILGTYSSTQDLTVSVVNNLNIETLVC